MLGAAVSVPAACGSDDDDSGSKDATGGGGVTQGKRAEVTRGINSAARSAPAT
jgi:hypothetical protein